MEGYKDNNENERDTEARASRMLDDLLHDPEHAFLTEHPANAERINAASSEAEALAIAVDLINKRLEATFVFESLNDHDSLEMKNPKPLGYKFVIDTILKNQQSIGEGQDAVVVIDKNEIKEYPPELCYKLAKEVVPGRGRNSLRTEASVHQLFYEYSRENNSSIGVPTPYYTVELGRVKMLAMERLQAKSIDDITRGKGIVPDWLDIDKFCDELEHFVKGMNAVDLYHRDLHFGNIMLTQAERETDIQGHVGFIIDFGVSAKADSIDPYRKVTAEGDFTFCEDYDMVKRVRQALKIWRDNSQSTRI